MTAARDIPRPTVIAPPGVVVIFGASGDLTWRKLIPALYNLEAEGSLPADFFIVGYARKEQHLEAFREHLRQGVLAFARAGADQPAIWERFAARLRYLAGGYDHPPSLQALGTLLDSLTAHNRDALRLFYFSLPPSAAESLLRAMHDAALVKGDDGRQHARILLEKPFGIDLDTARRLNRLVDEVVGETHVYRTDHYVAKDTVRNLLIFRFTNAIFEPIWNRRYVDHVQITAAESIGVEGRGGYYEEAGVVRDMVQNHVLQVLALCAMEPPIAGDAESVRDKTYEVFKAIVPPRPSDFVFGQYRGYRQEPRVAADSRTPTYVALRLFLNNWRWQGVPFYIRSGKALAQKCTEVTIQFKEVPTCVLDDEESCKMLMPNVLALRIQPNEGIRLTFSAKVPGARDDIMQAHLDFRYGDFGIPLPDAYERILLDCLCGRPALFWRADCVEAAWRAVAPLLDGPDDAVAATLPNYEPGTWGPRAADELLRRDKRSWLLPYA